MDATLINSFPETLKYVQKNIHEILSNGLPSLETHPRYPNGLSVSRNSCLNTVNKTVFDFA